MATPPQTPAQFFPELIPRYGLHPKTNQEYWPDEGSGDKEYNRITKYWIEGAYEEAKFEQGQNEEMKRITKYMDYIAGKQWSGRRPTYRSSPVNNRIWRLMWELVSLLTDIRPTFEIKATNRDFDKHAVMLNQVTRSWWTSSDADQALALAIIHAIITTGYLKLTWNPEKRQGEGDFELLPLGPNDLLPLKPRNTLESSQALIYRSAMPTGWFKRRFPTRGFLVQPDPHLSRYSSAAGQSSNAPGMFNDMLSSGMKRVMRIQPQIHQSTFPAAIYREFWLKDWTLNQSNVEVVMGDPATNWCYKVGPGQPLYPRGRLIIMGGREIMHDGPNPYWHGEFPFADIRMNIVPWQFMGMSELSPLIPLQDIINNILGGVLDMIKKAVNPGFYAPRTAFSESFWNSLDWSMPGMKAGYSLQTPTEPKFAPQPQLPAFVMNMMMLAGREMDHSSGVATAGQAMSKKQVPSSQTLDQIKEAQQTPLRLKGRNIEVCLRRLGSMNIFNVFQFYTLKRRMFMLGDEGATIEDFDWDPKTCVPAGTSAIDHARKFAFMIQPGSLLNVNKIERQIVLMRLRMMKDISRKHLLESLDLGLDIDDVNAELKRESKDEAALMMATQQMIQGGGGMQGGSGPRQSRLPKV